ncbi:P97 family adhesin [Mesomycoplasma ovipneumoniae]|uniref:P97 family adhesin n=1 Tax=Mesomycoplasma ovipneumoniae TaxID=29562 RepID=UPI002162F9B8|nr:hypothetical protein [Mesomycoplasma ovipneumoniae]UVO16026.1 hypothetical protein KW545_00275 [Mesomycoplasma ovipneumoniae]
MQKKNAKILIGSVAAIVLMSTVFGTVAGLAAKTKYRGVNPTQGVVSQLGLIDSVSFKPSVAHFTSDYKTVKQALLGGKTFNASSSEFSDFASKFNFLTNNGRSVLAIPNKYKVVIEKFEAQDEQQRFSLSFHLEETLEDKNVARSATKSIYLSVVDAPKAALAQFSDIVDSNFANLVPSPLSHFSSTSVKPLGLTRADDFAKTLNQFESLEDFESHLSKFFDIQAIKAKIRLEAQGFGFAKGDLEEPFVFSFVKNPQNQNEWATSLNQQVPSVRLYLKTEFGSQAKATLANYKNKDESFLTSIDLVASDKSTLFANTKDLSDQLDVNLLDASDYYIDLDKPQVDQSTGVLLPSSLSLFDRDLLRQASNKPVDKFSLFRYDAINFYKQLQELVSKPSAIKDIIDASLTRGLTFSFGKYDLLFDNLREHFDYDFLVSNAKIRQNSVSGKLFIELPIKIKLKSSIFGDSGQNIKTILEKTVSFKLDNFRDQSIEDALASLYPELSEQLTKLKDAQSAQDAAQQLAAISPIQSQWANKTLGATKENPYDLVQGAPKSYLLSKYEIKQLIDQGDYKKLIGLFSDPNSYNIDFKLGSTLQSQNIQVPSDKEIANLNATIDSAQALKNADIYSVSTSVFKNRASLFAYFRYLLSLEPKEAIKKLVNIGSQMGLEFEGYQDLPLNPTLADLAKVKIKTKFDNYEHSQDFLSEQDADENQDDSVGTKFGLKLLDFNGYFANDITSPNQGMALFLPASLDSNQTQSTSGTLNSTTPDWKEEIAKKLASDKNQLASLPFAIWDRIIGQEKQQEKDKKLTYKILKNYQEAIKIAKQPAFWNTVDTDNNPQVPFKDQNFSKIATLSDLVFAFYTQAALANNWNEYQDSGARPSIKFEIEDDAETSKEGNIIGLKIKYVVGFDDNAGKFVDDVIQSTPQTIFVRTSGQSEAEVKQKNNLDQMVEDAPLSSQSLILDAEKFGHLQILANSIYDKKKPKTEEETVKPNDSDIRWIDDKVPGQPRPEVKRPEINQDEFFKGKLRPVAVQVSTFSSLDESPYFASPFQDGSQTSPAPDSISQTSNEDLQTLKQKLEILLGQQFSEYFNKLDPNISFEIDSVKEVSPNVYSVSLSLVKNVGTTKVKSDKSLSLIVHKQQNNIPELAKSPQISNTSWAKQYNPDQPLANSTTITLEFKNQIPLENGQPTSQWLSSVPVTIHPALINISPQADVLDEAIANEILSRLDTNSLVGSPTPDTIMKVIKKEKIEEIIKGLRDKVSETTVNLIRPIQNAFVRHETTKTHTLSLAHIQNSNHSPIKLTLNSLTNTNSEVKVANLQLINEKTISFDLESSNIKRLINAPIEIASELSDKKFDLESMKVHNTLSQENSDSDTQTQTSTITFIKPKFIVERTVGVPWSTSEVVFAAKKNLNDPTKRDLSKVKDSSFFVYGWRIFTIPFGNQTFQTPALQVQPLFDPLVDMFPVPQVQSLTSLSFKVFDPDGYLYQKLYSKSTTNVDLYSYRLNQTKELSTRKGWTNQHPSQANFTNNNFSLPSNYLNIITNQPTKVTFYNASDFITDLFNDPDQKQEDINDKYTDNVKEKVGANAADWGSAYFNLWYPRKLIQEQSNIISANLNDLLFVDPDELEKNIKMIAPNFTNWWPNFQNSEVAEIRTKHNEEAFKKVNLLPQGWTQIHDGGYPLKVQKTAFNRDTRTFTLTTNLPIPTQDYYQDVKDTDDWRFVFQNDNNQIAMLKANMLKAGSKNPHYKDKGWIQFETVIPEHFFSTNVRFAGIFKQEDKKLKWLPIIDTEYVVDDRYFGNIISDPLDLKKARGRGFTNNAFGDIFKEFNIHRKKQS